MQLLQDVFIIENLQVINEGATKGPMKIRGVFGRCNEKNNNGRVYPTAVLEGQLKKVQPLIEERRLCGELDHPQNDTVKLSNASHLITKLDMKGEDLIGEAEILKTPAGLTAKALVEGGVKIGISSRGMGTLSEDHDGNKIVNEDFRLVTFDLVADPSTRGAFPGLSESTESKFVRESQDKLKKEQNFFTMLESKMRDVYNPWIEEAKAKKKKAKKDLPGNQEAIDADGDGKIEASDFKKLRNEAFELIKKDGHWHRIANHIVEAFADELEAEKDRGTKGPVAQDTGGMLANMRARSHAKKMEVAAAKGRAKGAGIEQKAQIKRARRMEKAKSAAASGKPVTGGEKAAALAGKAGSTALSVAKKTPGALKGAAEKTTQAAERYGERLGKAKVRGAKQEGARQRIADRRKDKVASNLAAASSKDGSASDAKKTKPTVDKAALAKAGKEKLAAASADVKRRAGNTAATSASLGREGSFGAEVGAKSKEDEAARQSTRKAIARRERKTGKKVKLTPQQAVKLERNAYRQLGMHLAETFGLYQTATN